MRKLTFSVLSGYAQLIAVALYSLASIPLALHYLSPKEFALWVLMSSLNGYLALIDLGMSGSIARLLIDSKDRRADGTYGGMIKTGWLVLLVQGILLCSLSYFLAPLVCQVLKIEPEFYDRFLSMLRWQGMILGFDFAVRISSHILQAHQRYDIINYSGIAALLLNFTFLWGFFHMGVGVFSLVWAWMIGNIGAVAVQMAACFRFRFFPMHGEWGRISWIQFRELFNYGKDVFLVALGTQLIMASQTLIVKRVLGLEAAAVWGVGTKVFNIILQVIWKPFDFSCAAFAEMMARREQTRLRERYQTISVLTFALSAVAAVCFALCNSLFVTIWTHGKIVWSPLNDLFLAGWMVVQTVNHCHNSFVLMTKNISMMRYVYFAEGIVFVVAALLTARLWGMAAVPASSIVCTAAMSCAYGIWRVSRYFALPISAVVGDWMKSTVLILLWFVPPAVLVWFAGFWIQPPLLRLILYVVFSGTIGAVLLLQFGIPRLFQAEILQRTPKVFAWFVKRAFNHPI